MNSRNRAVGRSVGFMEAGSWDVNCIHEFMEPGCWDISWIHGVGQLGHEIHEFMEAGS
jgi:hypothetical protein